MLDRGRQGNCIEWLQVTELIDRSSACLPLRGLNKSQVGYVIDYPKDPDRSLIGNAFLGRFLFREFSI